jgi:hypothetical protein
MTFMKKIKFLYTILAGALMMTSCEKSAPVLYNGGAFVHFQEESLTISESLDAKNDANGQQALFPSAAIVRINRATSDLSKDLVVNFNVSGRYIGLDGDGNEIDLGAIPTAGVYSLSSPNSITIKAGEAFAFLTVTAIDNVDRDFDKKLTITIQNTSDASLGIGYPGPDKKGASIVVTILDDDCPLVIGDYVGTLKVVDKAAVSDPTDHTYNVTSVQTGPNSIRITNLFDPATRYPSPTPCPAPVDIVFNLTTKDVILTPATQVAYYRAGTCPGTSNPRVVFLDVAKPSKINTCGRSFTLNYYVQNPLATGPFDVVTSTIRK